MPKTNIGFWERKITRNKQRDIEVCQKLASMGWHSITVWECQLKPSEREATLTSLDYTLSRIYLANHAKRQYRLPDATDTSMAAEPSPQ